MNESKQLGQKVFIINHYPIVASVPTHLLWNWKELLTILEDSAYQGTIVAYLNGHFHPGCFEKVVSSPMDSYFNLRNLESISGVLKVF